ncbi:hypothetical protein ACF3MZ_31090 [Paenibacillaceae bacterium WGS1546]|uniref:glucosamine inositolphosphorylceramide transferase family protein n=1 Tax=Cohnella sp. WGS1546 TaxID=3366810 RepID=UPI00372D59DE
MLKIAVIRDSSSWRSGEIACLRALGSSPYARIADIFESPAASPASRVPRWFDRLDRLLREPVAAPSEPGGLPGPRPVDEARLSELVGSGEWDAILDLRPGDSGRKLAKPKHGVWKFRYGDASYDDAAYAFRSLLADSPTGSVALVRLGDGPERDLPLKAGTIALPGFGYRAQLEELSRCCRAWPAYVCKDIAQTGDVAPSAERMPSAADGADRMPTVRQALRLAAALGYRKLSRLLASWFVAEHWNVGLIRRPIDSLVSESEFPPVEWLPEQRDFLADPFAVRREGGLELLAEEWSRTERKGKIAYLRLDPNLRADQAAPWKREALELPFHLSYPFVVQDGGRLYCVPESHQNGEAALYRADGFPSSWKKEKVLIRNFAAVDPTIFRYDGLWWLFCTDQEEGPHSHLHIWFSSELLGEWHPHPANPVKMDVRSSRPAGTPFLAGGELYRPAQDCSRTYGGAVWINRVATLTTKAFREEPVRRLAPDPSGPYPSGFHTVSSAGPFTLVDAKKETIALDVFLRRAWRKLAKLARIRRSEERRVGLERSRI